MNGADGSPRPCPAIGIGSCVAFAVPGGDYVPRTERRRVPRGQPSMARDTCHERRGKLDDRSCIQPR